MKYDTNDKIVKTGNGINSLTLIQQGLGELDAKLLPLFLVETHKSCSAILTTGRPRCSDIIYYASGNSVWRNLQRLHIRQNPHVQARRQEGSLVVYNE
jgi:hypothetical protein